MIRAKLFVRYTFDKDADGEPRTENWGEHDFVDLPRIGEAIYLIHDHDNHVLKVVRVEHFAVAHPLPPSESPFRQRTEPGLNVIADWSFAG